MHTIVYNFKDGSKPESFNFGPEFTEKEIRGLYTMAVNRAANHQKAAQIDTIVLFSNNLLQKVETPNILFN